MVAPLVSSAVFVHPALGRRPKMYLLRGWASIITPQLQSPLASRPPHRIDEMVVPAGAVNVCDELARIGTVSPVIRLLMPALTPPFAGHVEYAVPGMPAGRHASELYPGAASQETTV